MDAPKEYKGDDRKLWKRLFLGFQPKNEIEIEMAKRFMVWFKLFAQEREYVDANGTVTEGKNGVPYPSPHFSNMVKAEGEMRRLLNQLRPSIAEPKDDTEELGDFAGL